MVTMDEVQANLRAAVDEAFVETARGLTPWPDPHRPRPGSGPIVGEPPAEEEYSRCLDPAKWRLVGARARAWADALVTLGMASSDRSPIEWSPADGHGRPEITSAITLQPSDGGRPLVLAWTRFVDVDETGVIVASDRPARTNGVFPHCGCDACDDGSAAELERLDEAIGGIVATWP